MILSNQRGTYNKAGLDYQHENNVNFFNKFRRAKTKSNKNIFKRNYCERNKDIPPYGLKKL